MRTPSPTVDGGAQKPIAPLPIFAMSPKNDDSELRPMTPESADETPRKRAAKSSVNPPAKSSARTRAASGAAASEKKEKPAPKRRASTTADPSAKAAPRLTRTTLDSEVAATETFATGATTSALDSHDDGAINGG